MQLKKTSRGKPSLSGALLFSLGIAIIFATFVRMHYLGSSGDGDLLWNEKEAYLFIHGERRGYQISYFGYLIWLTKAYFGVMDSSDDRKSFTMVLQISPSGVQRHEQQGVFEYVTPLDAALYAAYDGDLWRWAHNRFEKASVQDRQKLDGINGLVRKDFTGVKGWSGRYSITNKIKDDLNIELGGAPMTIEVTTLDLRNGKVSIDLLRPKRAPEKLFFRSGRPQRVSKAEYQRAFAADSNNDEPRAAFLNGERHKHPIALRLRLLHPG